MKYLILISIFFGVFFFQACGKNKFSKEEKVVKEASVISPVSVFGKGSLTIEGTVRDAWGFYGNTAIGSDPISGVTLHLKKGLRADPATKGKPDFETQTTGSDGRFQFLNLPSGTYTIYWDVPKDHYYHENDYAAEFSTTSQTRTVDASGNIWIHKHGVSYHCAEPELAAAGLNVKLYETTAARSETKVSSMPKLTSVTGEGGYIYLDTAHLTGSGGGLVEISNASGVVIGKFVLEQVNHLALIGGGYCAL